MTNHGAPHMTKPGSISRRLLGSAVLAASMILLASPGQAQSGPFGNLAGAWSGSGKILIKDGGSESIRDFIAFPKNNSGRDVMLDAPSTIDDKQLEELNIQLAINVK